MGCSIRHAITAKRCGVHRKPLASRYCSIWRLHSAMGAAAEKEGKVVWYTAVDVKVAEAIAKSFKAGYPKIDVDTERWAKIYEDIFR